MSAFDWFLIGHLVGDWLLQNDWMAQGKKQGFFTWAGQVHFTIYTTATLGALGLSGLVAQTPAFYLGLGLLIFASHWLIDATNIVERWMRFYRQSNSGLMRVMVDQALHFIILGLLTFWCSK
jgi:hypothetical protein